MLKIGDKVSWIYNGLLFVGIIKNHNEARNYWNILVDAKDCPYNLNESTLYGVHLNEDDFQKLNEND